MTANQAIILAEDIKIAVEDTLAQMEAHLAVMEYKSAELHSIAMEIERKYGQAKVCAFTIKAKLTDFVVREQARIDQELKKAREEIK